MRRKAESIPWYGAREGASVARLLRAQEAVCKAAGRHDWAKIMGERAALAEERTAKAAAVAP